MSQMEIYHQNLDTKGLIFFANLLYREKGNIELVNSLVARFSLNELVKTKHNGLISNLLVHFILIDNNEKICEIVHYSVIHEFAMMKRDFLNLAKYYYLTDIELSISFFKKILSLCSSNTEPIIMQKDINFIIENKLFILLHQISELFIETTNSDYPIDIGSHLERKTINTQIISSVMESITESLGTKTIGLLTNFMASQRMSFAAIIDGGNVLHSRTRSINHHSMNDLENIIVQTKQNIGEPLLVIHRRHLKTIPNLISRLDALHTSYYLTPYNTNDDIFIMWFFLAMNSKPFIVSNDNYRDHVFNFETVKKTSDVEHNMSSFHFILHQQTIKYNVLNNTFGPVPTCSRCIYIQDDGKIFVPHHHGHFIVIEQT